MSARAQGVPRITAFLVGAAVVVAGLAGRALLPMSVGDPVGDVLFATLAVVLVALVRPRTTPAAASSFALVLCTALELSHLTGIPAQVAEQLPQARFALGTVFGALDLVWYALGAALGGVLLGVITPRARWVDGALRHGRAADERPRRGHAAVAVPLALLVAAGGGLGGTLWTEADDLSAQLHDARTTLAESQDKVADDGVRTDLAATIDDAEAVLDATPLLGRLPDDAARAGDLLEQQVAVVEESRLTFALAAAADARDALEPVTRRAARVLEASDELRADGLGPGKKVRSALGGALESAEGALEAAADDALDSAEVDAVDSATASLLSGREDLERATVDLMTAQDAVVCPFPDQVWFPEAGKLDPKRLVPIPWTPKHVVRADLLTGLTALNDAYRAQFGQNLSINSGYRSYAEQVEVYNPANPNPLAAPPGCSNHGLGTAVDISVGPEGFGSSRYAWLKDNAEQFGWTHPDWAEPDGRLPEPWHWQSVKTPTEY